ncbi:hypothetical protein Tco_0393866 [Tanacetum coccineum]
MPGLRRKHTEITAQPTPLQREWLKFNNRNFTLDSRKEFRKRLAEIQIKEIKCPEGLDFKEFGALHEGIALQNLDQFCQVIREYLMEFLSSFTFRDHTEELDEADTMVFQLGREKRSRYSGKEKVTMDDLFLLHRMDGGVSIDVPWHVAKFLYDKKKGYNGLGIGEMVVEIPEVARDDVIGAGQAEIGGVGLMCRCKKGGFQPERLARFGR